MNKVALNQRNLTKLFIKGAQLVYNAGEGENGVTIELPMDEMRFAIEHPVQLVNTQTDERRDMTPEEVMLFEIGLDKIADSFLGIALAKLIERR